MKFRNYIPALALSGLMLAVSAPAAAQAPSDNECEVDADCPDDFVCETLGWGACPSCIPDEPCPPCETGEQNVCVPPPPQECDSDNPCGGDDVCVTYTFESCSGGGSTPTVPVCDPDDASCEDVPEDEPPPEPECESSTESYCVPPYLAPCEADADCGAGFTCEAVEICGCSSEGAPGPGETEPDGEPDCSCEVLDDENYCRLIEVECESDSDCAADLSCQDSPEVSVDIACIPEEPCPEPEPVDTTSYCAPDGYGYFGGGRDYAETVAEASGNDDASVTSSQREEFFPVDGGDDGTGSDKSEPGGCSTTGNGEAGGMGLLAVLGLLGLRRRRRD